MGGKSRALRKREEHGNRSRGQGKPNEPPTDPCSPTTVCQADEGDEEWGEKEFEYKHVPISFHSRRELKGHRFMIHDPPMYSINIINKALREIANGNFQICVVQ